jgi:hypothetical protein
MRLTWDGSGERVFETGVDHGVLYLPTDGDYDTGVPWNGLVTVTESPSGAEATPLYADNIKYLNLKSREDFGATIEAYTYPDEFGECDGTVEISPGVKVGQQNRRSFGLSYRTKIGNDENQDAGYKLHLVYGADAAPSEKAYGTVNDTPDAITFSWSVTTTPVEVTGLKPTAILTIDSTTADADALAALEDELYGTGATEARLPLPDEVAALFAAGSLTTVDLATPANQPSYNAGTHVVTLPTVTGVQWKVNGVNKAPGAQPALAVGQTATVTPTLADGFVLSDNSDDDWSFEY